MKTRILGIDPGTNVLGYGLLDCDGRKAEVVMLGVLELKKLPDHYAKLKRIYDRVMNIIDEYKPQQLAIEAPFFGKNVQSMLKLGRAQGVCMAAAVAHDMPITEYAPLKVKQAITGHGDAAKEQVAAMLQRMLHFDDIPKYLDATDALGVAYCHFLQISSPVMSDRSVKSWKEFALKNPGRITK
ncbi:MAG: crossover junction endodeoxyribonuclease RuvC [Bacteroidales bacterium]|nr:crossover junction endodeoxyribonuclease RuvC [Bacteroidales bacterium]